MKTVGFCTLGCKVNTYESEYLKEQFKKAGYQIRDYHLVCDIYVINTCTVTNQSDRKSRKMIRYCRKLNQKAIIIAMGCFVEANPDFEEDADILIGNKGKSKILEYLENYQKTKKKIVVPSQEKTVFEDMFLTSFLGRTRAFVKIQDGCENFCTYCIIPYVRGQCRSKDFDSVIKEIKELVAHGYKEVVLTGIHTGHYGVDNEHSFAELLSEICKIEGLLRLRISSIEVTELKDDFLKVLKENPKIVNHLHIPLQAGCDATLKRMGRHYTLDFFQQKLDQLRQIRPEIAITTDVIVGFPGEREEDFEETLETVKKFGFMKVHVFPFSLRKNTAAEKLDGHITEHEKKERVRRLMYLSQTCERKYLETFVGKTVEVLVEYKKEGYSYGHTSNYMKVALNGNVRENTLVPVKITGFKDDTTLEGEKIQEVCEV